MPGASYAGSGAGGGGASAFQVDLATLDVLARALGIGVRARVM